jgi:predicted CXXCH cytochrome family protein
MQKFFIGLCLALPLLVISVIDGETRSPRQESTGNECQSCHADTYGDWSQSMHGRATDNRAFLLEWKKEGSPQACMNCHTTGFDPLTGEWAADGITCDVCHEPAPEDHPLQVMPTKATGEECGTCHVDTHDQWQVSGHGENELSCVNCHNPHTTEIKASDSQALCRTCHTEETHFYEFTAHAGEGLLCIDCHLRPTDASIGEGHGERIHTFDVDLRSCTQCHGAEMHYPVQNAMGPPQEEEPAAETPALVATITDQPLATRVVETVPESTSGVNYVLAVSVGLALGIIVAPGLDFLYHRLKR